QYLPSHGIYKVYGIDEVHMLSVSAFNALLKTLEEPPAHIVFLFATTDPEKLLETVISRCQKIDFRPVQLTILERHITKIAQQEKIQFAGADIVRQLCLKGKGSVRDTLSVLEQVVSLSIDKKITEESLLLSLGMARSSTIYQLLSALFLGRAHECSKIFKQILQENGDTKNIVLQILETT